MLVVAACGDETASETGDPDTGGEAAGEVLGGTISDEMIPLDQLTSTSPPAEPRVTSTTTTSSNDGTTQTTVETMVTTTSDPDAPAPTPPEPPVTPEQ